MFSPKATPAKKKLEFNMASKIQIIPNNRQGQLNTGFLGTIGGVLKVAEIVSTAFLISTKLRFLNYRFRKKGLSIRDQLKNNF